MKLLYGHDAEVAHWVAQRIAHVGDGASFGPCVAIGVIDGAGVLKGGVVYHNWLPTYGNVELSFASEGRRWLTREIICSLLRYAWVQLQVIRLTAVTPQTATSARRFLDDFGFKREGVVRQGFGKTENAIISGLLRREWEASKWAKPLAQRREARLRAHGQENTVTAAAA